MHQGDVIEGATIRLGGEPTAVEAVVLVDGARAVTVDVGGVVSVSQGAL